MTDRDVLIEKIAAAIANSKARDDEGDFPYLIDFIDFSGEDKIWTVLRAAAEAALSVIEVK